ncbi:Zn(II)2Cys6 transcription factor [Aspergillus homomorphus CBS 101889]|uniref:C6 transcription factor n=1 Tax=Aspergillus homomorphus (strain CBS 101889) TaxID=1450537 RepID=A0A395I693_ASPHC|nr:C6 transcription factor [Aspergillus homomorphus CBS 101889]RAL15640.1 C6 transcription factor [Aspergillus homomorphus CBS 101889]
MWEDTFSENTCQPHTAMNSLQSQFHIISKKRSRREGGTWTRSGCLTCKRRRKRCDEAKPGCRSCARLGLQCEGYGSMWAEPLNPSAQVFSHAKSAKRRRLSTSSSLPAFSPGSNSVKSPDPSTLWLQNLPTSPTTPSESGTSDVCLLNPNDIHSEDGQVLSPATAETMNLAIVAPTPCRPLSHLSQLESHYLRYHMELGSKLLANLESADNPLRSLIIPRALSSSLLMKALCAVSATHCANRIAYHWEAQTAATTYYIQTLKGLQSVLSEYTAGSFPDEAILAVALLCKYEIVRGSVKQWVAHLNALQGLVIARGGFSALSQDTREFLMGFYIYAHNVAKISNRKQVTSSMLEDESIRITKLDIYIGYAEDLVKLCARIADLPFLSHDPAALGLEIHAVDTSLRDWTHQDIEYIIPEGITEMNLCRLRMVANCFRDAAYIYLYSILEKMSKGMKTVFAAAPWSTFITMPRSGALHQLLGRIRTASPLNAHCEYSALTFPLLIAGCEVKDSEDKDLILACLTSLEVNFGIGNVKRAKELLRALWTTEGVHWLDLLEQLQWDLILA